MKIRSFLAFDIPGGVRNHLAALIEDLRQYGADVQWMDPATLHVTIRFFGDVEESRLLGPIREQVAALLVASPVVQLECAGVGVFPNWKYPRVIWTGFSGDVEPVIALHDRMNHALQDFSLKPDARTFRLHLTIGRVRSGKKKEALVKRVESLGPVSFGEVAVTQLVLYKSQLTKQGAVYTPLETFALSASASSHDSQPKELP